MHQIRSSRYIPLFLALFAAVLVNGTTDSAALETEATALEKNSNRAGAVRSPMLNEIRELYAASAERLAALKVELGKAGDLEEQLRLRRAIQEEKRNAEIEMFRIQLRYAEKRGDWKNVKKLEQTIHALVDPETYMKERMREARIETSPQTK